MKGPTWRERALAAEQALAEQQDDIDEALEKLDSQTSALNDATTAATGARRWLEQLMGRSNVTGVKVSEGDFRELAKMLGLDYDAMRYDLYSNYSNYYANRITTTPPNLSKLLISGV